MKTLTIFINIITNNTKDKVFVFDFVVGFGSKKNMFRGFKVKNMKNTKQEKERGV
jgi:hypothetical protein